MKINESIKCAGAFWCSLKKEFGKEFRAEFPRGFKKELSEGLRKEFGPDFKAKLSEEFYKGLKKESAKELNPSFVSKLKAKLRADFWAIFGAARFVGGKLACMLVLLVRIIFRAFRVGFSSVWATMKAFRKG